MAGMGGRTVAARMPRPAAPRLQPPFRGGASRPAAILLPQAPTEAPVFVASGQSLLARYPTAIDQAPVFVDGLTPLVAMWVALLQQLIETVEAEIGPIPDGIYRQHMGAVGGSAVKSLMELLGRQTCTQPPYEVGSSNAALCTAVAGNGKPAGTLYGVQKARVTIGTTWDQSSVVLSNPFGINPSWRLPIAWGYPVQTGTSLADVLGNGPSRIVARVELRNQGATCTDIDWTVAFAGAKADAGVVPGGYTMDVCIIYMPTEDD